MANENQLGSVSISVKEDRYSALRLIEWWNQEKLKNSVALVLGAGAIGNEVLKNLALLGVGRIIIADFDQVETVNLCRSVLFRDEDVGRRKADAAADGVRRLNPEVLAFSVPGDFRLTIGLGTFRRVDMVLGCLDSREARLALNRCCYQTGRPWVDGAIHSLLGEARVFSPGRGACYECTLTDADYKLISARYSCQSIRRDPTFEPRVPTTPTIASIVGAAEVQNVVKMLHGRDVESGQAQVFNGVTNDSWTVRLPLKENCMSHEILGPIVERADLTSRLSVREFLGRVREDLGGDAVLDLGFDLLTRLGCSCGDGTVDVLQPALKFTERDLKCPVCGAVRTAQLQHLLDGNGELADRSLASLGVSPLSVLAVRANGRLHYIELRGDMASVPWFRHSGAPAVEEAS